MTYLEPDAGRARALGAAMEQSLWASVRMVLSERGVPIPNGAQTSMPAPPYASLLDFGAYFDLVLTPPDLAELPDETKAEAAQYLVGRLLGNSDGNGAGPGKSPAVANFARTDYTPAQMERLTRWWDIESATYMGMTGLSGDEMARARSRLAAAMEKLELASPDLYGEVVSTIGTIVMGKPDGTQRMDYGGVTSFALWGAFTINAQGHDCWEHYFQTVVHETSHNLLFAIAREEPLVADDPNDRHHSPLREDARPMDGIFHAAFVSARECMAFDAMLCRHEDDPILTDQEEAMLADLLEVSVVAFWECSETLRKDARLTGLGKAVLDECETYMRASFRLENA